MTARQTTGVGPRALIATNHLDRLAGSEIVALEMAQQLFARGMNVSFFANFAGSPMANIIRSTLGVDVVVNPLEIKPFQYDVCYLQHQVAPLFTYSETPDDRERTTFVFGRLAPKSFLESGGWAHDNALGDITFANSEETAERLVATGVSHPIQTFYNAAPRPFFAGERTFLERPSRILVVTSHRDKELLNAINLLRKDFVVNHLGRSGEEVRLITPEIINSFDLVISIGKTVPYALAARTPVYVYDHLGGPGYLNDCNFARASHFNFSGRCSDRKLSAEDIRKDVVSRYAEGVEFAKTLAEPTLDKFRLDQYIDGILGIKARATEEKRRDLRNASRYVALERRMAHYVRIEYIKGRRLTT